MLIQRYQIIKELRQEDILSKVYLAFDPLNEKEVAIKVFRKSFDGQDDDDAMELFFREAMILSTFESPHFVKVLDFEKAYDPPFMVMELLKGDDLRDVMFRDNECLTSETKFKIIMQMVAGVNYMHKKDIFHRNLDFRNIFITENMLVKIIGFCNVKSLKGMVMKNLSYASPEEFKGKLVDHRTDLYQLGTIFYELFSGRHPFSPSSSMQERMYKILHETPSSIKELDPEYHFLERVIMRLLEKEPDKRYQSALDLLNDLTENEADRQQGTWYRHLLRGILRVLR